MSIITILSMRVDLVMPALSEILKSAEKQDKLHKQRVVEKVLQVIFLQRAYIRCVLGIGLLRLGCM